MYTAEEEFEVVVDGVPEYFTCLANISIKGKEYIIAENDEGSRKVFLYEPLEESIEELEDDDTEEVLAFWEEEYVGTDKDYMFWNEDFGEYDKDAEKDVKLEDLDDMPLDDLSDMDDDLMPIVAGSEMDEEKFEELLENLLD